MNHIPGTRQWKRIISTSTRQINDGFRAFYNNLYSTQGSLDEQEFEAFFTDLNLLLLSITDQQITEAPITVEEITHAINSMSLNKAPGLDGLPLDFYRALEDMLSPHAVRCL